jgi:hypothetical protein
VELPDDGTAGRVEVGTTKHLRSVVSLVKLEEVAALYSALPPAERDELLQDILTAAPHGGEAMIEVPEAWLLDRAVREAIERLRPAP